MKHPQRPKHKTNNAKMHLHIHAVGQYRTAPETAACQDYLQRVRAAGAAGLTDINLHEVKERKNLKGAARKKAEGALLQANIKTPCFLIALDEGGKTITSRKFANLLVKKQQEGHSQLAFLIGGADGLDADILAQADMKLSLGAMTWPHLMARLMLCEQLWRAVSILTNHPYHRD